MIPESIDSCIESDLVSGTLVDRGADSHGSVGEVIALPRMYACNVFAPVWQHCTHVSAQTTSRTTQNVYIYHFRHMSQNRQCRKPKSANMSDRVKELQWASAVLESLCHCF